MKVSGSHERHSTDECWPFDRATTRRGTGLDTGEAAAAVLGAFAAGGRLGATGLAADCCRSARLAQTHEYSRRLSQS